MPEVAVWSRSLEDNAMVQYQGRQAMAVIKGVEDNFDILTPIDSILYGRGELTLHDEVAHYAIPGIQLLATLGSSIRFLDPLEVYAPRRGAKVNLANPSTAFVTGSLFSSGLVFSVNQEKYDASYILTSIDFARSLFQYTTEVSAVNLRLAPGADTEAVKRQIQQQLGGDFRVEDRYEQQADTYRIMRVEKLISYLFLTFILVIACFNIIGSLSMLIIDKRDDVATLRNLGASDKQIVRIFLFEGRMISFIGASVGVVLGLMLCWVATSIRADKIRQFGQLCGRCLSRQCGSDRCGSGLCHRPRGRFPIGVVSCALPQQAVAEVTAFSKIRCVICVIPKECGQCIVQKIDNGLKTSLIRYFNFRQKSSECKVPLTCYP